MSLGDNPSIARSTGGKDHMVENLDEERILQSPEHFSYHGSTPVSQIFEASRSPHPDQLCPPSTYSPQSAGRFSNASHRTFTPSIQQDYMSRGNAEGTDLLQDRTELSGGDTNCFHSQDALFEQDLVQRRMAEVRQHTSRNTSLKAMELKDARQGKRNLPIAAPFQSLGEHTHNGVKLNPKASVQLRDGDFMRIVDIILDIASGAVILHGWIFRRTREMNGLLEKKRNELCWILHVDEDDKRAPIVQGMESISVAQVIRRRKIRITNQAFPTFSFRDDVIPGTVRDTTSTIENERVLVCRYKYVCSYANADMRQQYMWSEKALQRVPAGECDPLLAKADLELRYDWRGSTFKGGACATMPLEEQRFLRDEYQVQYDLRSIGTAPQPLEQSTRSGCSASSVVDLEDLADLETAGSQSDDDVIELSNTIIGSKKRIIDLTDETLSRPLLRWPLLGSRHSTLALRSVRETTPEVIDIDAVINTTSRTGTLRERYEGRVTTSFTPRPNILSRRERPVGGNSEPPPRKRPRINSRGYYPVQIRESISPRDPTSNLMCIDKTQTPASTRADAWNQPRNRANSPDTSSTSSSDISDTYSLFSELLYPSRSDRLAGFAPSAAASLIPKPASSSPSLPTQDAFRYTVGDCFCGAGGVSRGAVMAGLKVNWAFDFNKHACESYALNNPYTSLYPIAADDFCNNVGGDFKIDILHLSPPCQYFSDAHTVVGKDDDMNTASLFAISELIKKAKPRVITLEQTSGLLRRHEIYFNAVIQMFTAHGFSIRWRILDCADYGVPQRRKRVFMLASCPGEPLPPFPPSTHSSDPTATGLKPWTTVNQAITPIPSGWPNHDIENAQPRARAPESGEKVAKCITTHGGGMIHPSGGRDLTDREFACLQGFPLEHKFGKTSVKKQIGNAVPPMVAKVILEEVKKALMVADGLLR